MNMQVIVHFINKQWDVFQNHLQSPSEHSKQPEENPRWSGSPSQFSAIVNKETQQLIMIF
jgi:hypothetical protein